MVKSLSPTTINCKNYNTFIYITKIITISIVIVILISLNNLEQQSKLNCKCADLPHRMFLKEWFMFNIFTVVLVLIIFLVGNEECWYNFIKYPYIFGFNFIFTIINVVMIIRLFLYIRLLRDNCECAYGNKERFIYWYLIIIFCLWALILVLILLMFILTIIKIYNVYIK